MTGRELYTAWAAAYVSHAGPHVDGTERHVEWERLTTAQQYAWDAAVESVHETAYEESYHEHDVEGLTNKLEKARETLEYIFNEAETLDEAVAEASGAWDQTA